MQCKLSRQKMKSSSLSARTNAAMWGQMRLHDDIFYFRYHDQSPLWLVVPPSAVSAIANEPHPELGHTGQSKTEKTVRQRCWWPENKRDIMTACNTCATCACIKHPTARTRAPLMSMCSACPNQRLDIDFVCPFTRLIHFCTCQFTLPYRSPPLFFSISISC